MRSSSFLLIRGSDVQPELRISSVHSSSIGMTGSDD
jgi:hypothetical protein